MISRSHVDVCFKLCRVCGSVDAELHRLHINLETSHLKKHHRKSLLSSIEHGINRLLRVMTPRQKTHLGPEPQRVMVCHARYFMLSAESLILLIIYS